MLFFGARPSFAKEIQQAMTITPIVKDIELHPGQTTSYTIVISNTADLPLGIHTDVTGFNESDEGTETFSTTDSPLSHWTRVSDQDITLDPHTSRQITVTATPPSSLQKGGYYTALFFTPFISKPNAPGPIVLSRVGALIFGTYGDINYQDLAKKVKVAHFGVSNHNTQTQIDFSVNNLYFTHFTAKPFLTLQPIFGEEQKYQLSEKHILPSHTKNWEETIPSHAIFIGKAILAVSVGQGNYVYTTTPLILLPWSIIFTILCLVILFIITTIFRQRIIKAIRILMKGNNQSSH